MSDVALPEGARWNGPPDLLPLLVPVEEITTHPDNDRRGDLDRIAASLERFGQMRPAAVQSSTKRILAGNHTYRAAVEKLGWTHFARVEADVDDDEAIGYLVADNRTADVGEYDDAAHAALLQRLMDSGKLIGTGYTADEVDDEIARIHAIAETPVEDFLGGHSETAEELAAREAARAAAPIMREVVLMYPPEQYVRFGQFIKIIEKEYGTKGVIPTVYEMAEREARRVNAEGDEAT